MPGMQHANEALFIQLIRAIVGGDTAGAAKLLESYPSLARQHLGEGATRQAPTDFFFREIRHYLYGGDTPLHEAAAGYRLSIVKKLVEKGALVTAANRRGAHPLHYAADGSPGSCAWSPSAQAEVPRFFD